MTRAVNVDALVAEVNNLADELETVLALGADPLAFGRVNALIDTLNDLEFLLSHAATARRIVFSLQTILARRGDALAEVHGLPHGERAPTEQAHIHPGQFGERFASILPGAPHADNDEVPF